MEDLGCFVVTCGKYYISTSNAHVVSLRRNQCHLPRIRPCSLWASKTEVYREFSRKKEKKNPLNNPQRGKSYLDLQQCFVIIAHHQDANKRTKTYRAKEQKRALIRNFISQYYLGPEVCFALSMQEQWGDSSTPVKPENPKIPFVSTGEEQKSLVPRPRGWLQGPVTRCIGDPHSKGSSNGI